MPPLSAARPDTHRAPARPSRPAWHLPPALRPGLPLLGLLVQWWVLLGVPALSRPAAYAVMVLAPWAAALAVAWRARREAPPGRRGWRALALSLTIWGLGAAGNLWQELVQGQTGQMYPEPMLAFCLATVPLAWVLATEWAPGVRLAVRWIDAVVAMALGLVFFRVVWRLLTNGVMPGESGITAMVWLHDAQDLYLTLGALVRWRAAQDAAERRLFGAVALYTAAYLGLAALNNHWFAPDPARGPEYGALITAAFAVAAAAALWPAQPRTVAPSALLVNTVRSASPVLLAGALLLQSLALIRLDYAAGAAGVLVAVLGLALRSTLTQVQHINRGDSLQREQLRLQAVAATDALTGIPNRRFLGQALETAWRLHLRNGRPLAVLMVDIDWFKQFNDHLGHPAGDACLRDVARVLQAALVRPGDVLVRYGGEEFIALLHDADTAAALVVAERMRQAVVALAVAHSHSPLGIVTVSLGAASTLPVSRLSLSAAEGTAALVQAADAALYQAKQAGRNRAAT